MSASLLIAIAFLGNNLILNINADNTDIRIDRAGRAAAAGSVQETTTPLPCRSSESTA